MEPPTIHLCAADPALISQFIRRCLKVTAKFSLAELLPQSMEASVKALLVFKEAAVWTPAFRTLPRTQTVGFMQSPCRVTGSRSLAVSIPSGSPSVLALVLHCFHVAPSI